MKVLIFSAAIILVIMPLSGCLDLDESDDDRIGIIVTLPPQIEMVEALGGNNVKVTEMVPSGQSPHAYEPVPSQIKAVAEAIAYFKIGTGIEFEVNHLDFLQEKNQDMKMFDCSVGVPLLEVGEQYNGHEHTRDNIKELTRGDHDEDPHIWLAPSNAKIMVRNIYDGLVTIDPENKNFYEGNLHLYLTKLDELINDTHSKLEQYTGREFLVYHPSWTYLAYEFNLTQLAIEESGKEPGPAELAAIIDKAKEHNINVIFISPQFDKANAEYIANEIDGRVETIDPLNENYIENLQSVINKLMNTFNID